MKIGFYGNNTDRLSFASMMCKRNIKIDAVFSDDTQQCVEKAVELGAKACFDISELTQMCDVIAVSVGDNDLRKAVLKLAKQDLSGKIVCAESVSAICDALNDTGADAVATVFTPDGKTIYIEGKGAGYTDFKRFLANNNIGVNEISPCDKEKIDLAMFYVKSGISTLIGMARELIGDTEGFDDIIYANVENTLLSNGKTGVVEDFDIGAIRRYNENAKGNNLAVYQTLILKAVEFANLSAGEKDRIKSIIIGR